MSLEGLTKPLKSGLNPGCTPSHLFDLGKVTQYLCGYESIDNTSLGIYRLNAISACKVQYITWLVPSRDGSK